MLAVKTVTYCSDVSFLDDPQVYDRAYESMPEYRRKKVDAFKFPKDKKLSMGVELLLRKAMSDLGEDMGDMSISKDGKPFLVGSKIQFNLSHSGTMAMCSVSDKEVGCDVELVEPIDLRIAEKFFFDSEYDTIASLEGDSRYEMFYRFWTLKESFMKITGLGMRLPLNSFRITLGDEIKVDQSVDDRQYHFREFFLDDGYRYACCSLDKDIEDIIPIEGTDMMY